MTLDYSIAIIGGGVVGCAIAHELANRGYKNIVVLERNSTIPGLNQSSTNEGTIHSGVIYIRDVMPLKATLSVEGNRLMYAFCQKYHLPHKKMGAFVIATNPREEEYLHLYMRVGTENGLEDLRMLSSTEFKKVEPNFTNITSVLYVPSAGSGATTPLILKLKELAQRNGVVFYLGEKVIDVIPSQNGFTIRTESSSGTNSIKTAKLINSAGLYADDVAKMVNPESIYEIEPTRGEFFQFDKSQRKNIWTSGIHVYLPPYCYYNHNGQMTVVTPPIHELTPLLKEGKITMTVGAHLSPAYEEINGEWVLKDRVTISPLKTLGLGKEDYTSKLHPAADYIKKIHHFFPNLNEEDIKPDHTGIMAVLKGSRDWKIERDRRFSRCINLVGMDSPAWTSCLAIAKYVGELLESQ